MVIKIQQNMNKIVLCMIFLASLPGLLYPSGKPEDVLKQADQVKNALQETVEGAGDTIVAIFPFNYSNGLSEKERAAVFNEVAVALTRSPMFLPKNLQPWADANFTTTPASNIDAVFSKLKEDKINPAYLLTGNVFRIGNRYGIKLSLYPADDPRKATHYYRDTDTLGSFVALVRDIVREMEIRTKNVPVPVSSGSLFISDIGMMFYLYNEDKKKKTELDFLRHRGITYEETDCFFTELLEYSFHSSRIINSFTGNHKTLLKGEPDNASDYILTGHFEVNKLRMSENSKNETYLHIELKDKKKRILFTTSYYIDEINLESFRHLAALAAKDITMTILEDRDEKNKAVFISYLESFYSDEALYLDDYYIGCGDQENFFYPGTRIPELKTRFTRDWEKTKNIKGSSFSENWIDDNRADMLIGLKYTQGLFSLNVNDPAGFNPVLSYGGGIDFSWENGMFGYSASLNARYGWDSAGQTFLTSQAAFLPYFLFLPEDSAFRLYTGLGVTTSLMYNRTGGTDYMLLPSGVFPEFGCLYQFMIFRLKLGLAYNFELHKFIFADDATGKNFNTDNFTLSLACSVYLN